MTLADSPIPRSHRAGQSSTYCGSCAQNKRNGKRGEGSPSHAEVANKSGLGTRFQDAAVFASEEKIGHAQIPGVCLM